VIVKKLKRAVGRVGAASVIVGGGVSANQGLRRVLGRFHVPVHFPKKEYCTDNAAMSAGLACLLMEHGYRSPLSLDAVTHSQFAEV
jgi:N6-L-threonylcarbamoyladenine synthase